MTLTARAFAALVAGLSAGIVLTAAASPAFVAQVSAVAEPLGGIWLDALQGTIIPLVFALLFTAVASAANTATASRLAGRALLVFAGLALLSGTLGVILVPALLQVWPIPAQAARALLAQEYATAAAPVALSATAWFRSFVPPNIIAAATEGKMLPIVVFALAFALAATRIAPPLLEALNRFFDATVQTMLVLVHWVLLAAPAGVFALALLVGARAGIGAVGVLAHYVTIVIVSELVLIALVYAGAALFVRGHFTDFARAAIPAQVVAVSTQSSIATLPAMVEAATGQLGVPEATASLVLPLAVSVFRITSPLANLAVVIYVATLHGQALSSFTLAAGVAVAFAVSIAAVGLPGQVSFITSIAPICLAMGISISTLPLLIAVEMLPDIFRTLGNVTADLAVAAGLARRDPVAVRARLEQAAK